MAHRLTKQAITTHTPAVQGVVGRPAYWEMVIVKRPVTTYGGSSTTQLVPVYGIVRNPDTGLDEQKIIGSKPAGTAVTKYQDVATYVFHPATPGVEGRDALVSIDSQLGWNSGARSKDVLVDDFSCSFTVPVGVVGVLAGLVDPSAPQGSYGRIEHGLMVTADGGVSVVESGAPSVQLVPPGTAGPMQCLITRNEGVVTYKVNDEPAFRSQQASAGPKSLGAVLYAANDNVDDPALTGIAPMAAKDAWGWADDVSVTSFRAASAWAWPGTVSLGDGVSSTPFGLTMQASDYDRASAGMVMDEPTLESRAGFVVVESTGIQALFSLDMAAIGSQVDVGGASGVIGMTMHSADYDYSDATLVVDAPDVWALSTEEPAGQTDTAAVFAVADTYTFDPVLYALISERISIGSTIELLISIDADLADHLALMSDADAPMILQAVLDNRIRFSDSLANINRMLIQYTTNLATGSVGRYEGFAFDGFCRVGMDTFGFKHDGLYRIGAGDDNGSLINAILELSADDFGTAQGKRVGNVFLGLGTDGDVYVRLVEDDQTERTYRAYQRRAEHRADFAKGAKSRFWRLRLEINDASHVELDNVEWVLAPTGRRT